MAILGIVGLVALLYVVSALGLMYLLVKRENRRVTPEEEEQNPYIVPNRIAARLREKKSWLATYLFPLALAIWFFFGEDK